jgi:hypothetical protein
MCIYYLKSYKHSGTFKINHIKWLKLEEQKTAGSIKLEKFFLPVEFIKAKAVALALIFFF